MICSKIFITFTVVLTFCCMLVTTHPFDFNDKDHLQEHMKGELDMATLSGQDLQFLYFQSHDAEANNKLDGCELVQSLLHFHSEESTTHGQSTKVFSDAELSMMVDPVLAIADMNRDGFIDYPEFVSGQYPVGM